MTPAAKRELLTALRPRYLKASKAEKSRILDEFVAATGYHRKYAIQLLKHGPPPPRVGVRRTTPTPYTRAVVAALVQVWQASGYLCAKRLHPFMGELLDSLERHGELVLAPPIKGLLCQMSPATIDRKLQPARARRGRQRGLSTTRPGTLLKDAIPIRTFADWDEQQPGFVEIDLVAHCGDTTAGTYLNTLCLVDVHTHWCELAALPNKGQAATFAALKVLRHQLPFPLLGIDSDNGGEFINDQLFRYCQAEHITFTRSRPHRKNDQAHVEQKNWTAVRRVIGYDRYESAQALAWLAAIDDDLRLFINFFQPTMKLLDKTCQGSKVRRRYAPAQTPYQRVNASPHVTDEDKAALRQLYRSLNPLALQRQIEAHLHLLWQLDL
ncbi:MAG: transposase family protein [Anaerolineae bacterium]|nr:transposase family protein [Anaerolineae bacterium]